MDNDEENIYKSPVILSIMYDSLEKVKNILCTEGEKGRNWINIRFTSGFFGGQTLLMVIFHSRTRHTDDIFEYLLSRGADWEAIMKDDHTIEELIIARGYVNMIRILEEHKEGLNIIKPAKLR